MLAADFASIIADMPTSVIIGSNAACNAVVTDLQEGDTLLMAGVDGDDNVSVHVPVASLTIAPAQGQKVVIGSKTFRCVKLITSPDGIEYRLDCEEESA